MAAYIYANGQYHLLAGNKIVKDGAMLPMKSTDKIIINGTAYPLGFSSGGTPETPVVPDAPECNIVHDNGTEPTTGTVRYITPSGAGTMDGLSWENAANMSMIHVILLSCTSGDRVYFSEGNYTADRTLTLPSGVSLFGGFTAENPTWATRDAFLHPTKWTASHEGAWLSSTANIAGQLVDGFTLINYSGTSSGCVNITFRNGFISGGSFNWGGTLENCYLGSATLSKIKATNCWAVNCTTVSGIFGDNATNCTAVNCTVSNSSACIFYGNSSLDCRAVNCRAGIIFGGPPSSYTATNCTAVNCTSYSDIFGDTATNCTAVKCTSSSDIFGYTATNCTAVNCTANNSVFFRTATNCTAVNCTSSSSTSSSNIFSDTATNCTAVNCTSSSSHGYIFAGHSTNIKTTNCIAVNCTSSSDIFGDTATNCTAVNCTAYSEIFASAGLIIKNCLSWNNSGREYYHPYTNTCAGSVYNSALALTLGTDNSIARFTNTGYAPAQGVQDVGDCPNPITDPDGYAAYVASFGDWHPAANSFLLGAGTADSNVTTDLDGTTRPNPPAIGAYEVKQTA